MSKSLLLISSLATLAASLVGGCASLSRISTLGQLKFEVVQADGTRVTHDLKLSPFEVTGPNGKLRDSYADQAKNIHRADIKGRVRKLTDPKTVYLAWTGKLKTRTRRVDSSFPDPVEFSDFRIQNGPAALGNLAINIDHEYPGSKDFGSFETNGRQYMIELTVPKPSYEMGFPIRAGSFGIILGIPTVHLEVLEGDSREVVATWDPGRLTLFTSDGNLAAALGSLGMVLEAWSIQLDQIADQESD